MNDNCKKLLIFCSMILICALALHLIFSGDSLNEFKKTTEVPVSSEVEQFARKAIDYIKEDDMKGLYSLMYSSDYGLFVSNYERGLFAEKDFAPVKFTGRNRKVAKSTTENILMEVRSEKREKNYWISIVKYKGEWKVAAISKFNLPN